MGRASGLHDLVKFRVAALLTPSSSTTDAKWHCNSSASTRAYRRFPLNPLKTSGDHSRHPAACEFPSLIAAEVTDEGQSERAISCASNHSHHHMDRSVVLPSSGDQYGTNEIRTKGLVERWRR